MNDPMKACPFCGGEGRIIPDPGNKYRQNILYRPQCHECGANLGGFDESALAVIAWNRRHPRAAHDGDVLMVEARAFLAAMKE